MDTLVLTVDAAQPQPERIEQAAEVLRRGGLVAFPTETVYGLGANALDRIAVANIFLAKGRPARNPLIVHLAEVEDVARVAAAWPAVASLLADHFWPGPLTLVLPRRDSVPDTVTAGGPTVAVRVASHPVARALIRAAGVPVAAPSANRSTQLSPTRAEHVLRGLAGRIDLLLDGGPTAAGIESTVLDVTVSPPRLLRPGPISLTELQALLGPLEVLQSVTPGPTGVLVSPGLLARHYAPHTPMECRADAVERAIDLARSGVRVGLLTFADPQCPVGRAFQPDSQAGKPDLQGVQVLTLLADPAGYAAELYAALHVLDDAGLEQILVTEPPDSPDWLAVRDRLRRASN